MPWICYVTWHVASVATSSLSNRKLKKLMRYTNTQLYGCASYASWHHSRIIRTSILRASAKHGGFAGSLNMRSR